MPSPIGRSPKSLRGHVYGSRSRKNDQRATSWKQRGVGVSGANEGSEVSSSEASTQDNAVINSALNEWDRPPYV